MAVMLVFWALLAGFAAITALMFGFTLVLRRFAPQWARPSAHLSPAFVLANLASAFVAGAAGGYISAWIARNNPLGGTLALAIVVLVMSAVSALEQRGKQPAAFQVAMVVISPVSVLAGGMIRLQVLGLTWAGIRFTG